MRMRLTDLSVRKLSLPPLGQKTYWDETTPGFGVRCSSRSKSYVVMYGAKRKLRTLGRYPDLSLADARRQAKQQLVQAQSISLGLRSIDYETARREYLADCATRLRATTLCGYSMYLNAMHFSGPVDRITRQDMLRKVRERTDSPSSQNYAFTTLKVFFNWLVRHQYLENNPLNGISRPHSPRSRNRVLSRSETTQLLRHTTKNRGRFHDIVSLLLLTGQRRGEIAYLKWEEVLEDHLAFSAERTKNKQAHEVPIPELAQDLLKSVEGGSSYVFGTPEMDVPFSGWTKARRRLHRETGLDPFTLHDLRRTFATLHAEIGTPIHVTERLLNHRSGTISGVAAIYNRHSYWSEMIEATKEYNSLLAKLIDSQ